MASTTEPELHRDGDENAPPEDEDTGAHVAPIVKLEEVAVTTGEEDEDPILDLYNNFTDTLSLLFILLDCEFELRSLLQESEAVSVRQGRESVEGARRWECEAAETQGYWKGEAPHAPIQDSQDLRKSSRYYIIALHFLDYILLQLESFYINKIILSHKDNN